MFLLKKLVSAFLLPLPTAVALLTTAVAVLWFTRRERLGKVLATTALGLLALTTFDIVGDGLLRPLESRYPPLYPHPELERVEARAGRPLQWIVVLGAGNAIDARFTPAELLSEAALQRLTEAVRLHREMP